jgi:hypothetical protein
VGGEAATLTLGGFPPAVAAAITKIAGVLGITVGQALALALVLLIIVTYQLTAIVAQVKGREFFDETFKNSIALQHPVIALGALGVVTAPNPDWTISGSPARRQYAYSRAAALGVF